MVYFHLWGIQVLTSATIIYWTNMLVPEQLDYFAKCNLKSSLISLYTNDSFSHQFKPSSKVSSDWFKDNLSTCATNFSCLLALSVLLTERLHKYCHESQRTPGYVIMATTSSPLLPSLCWPDPSMCIHPCMGVFEWEGQWRGLYGPPGSCKRWLMVLWCSRCNSSFPDSGKQRGGLVLEEQDEIDLLEIGEGKTTTAAMADFFSCTAEELMA